MSFNSIVFLLPSLKSGGGNRVAIEISNELVLMGFEIYIIYPNNSAELCDYYINELIHLVPIGSLANTNASKLKNLKKTFSYVNENFSCKKNPIIFTDPIMSLFSFAVRSKNKYRFIQADDYKIYDDLYVLKNIFFLFVYKVLTCVSYIFFNVKYIFNSKYTYERFNAIKKIKTSPFNLVHPAINHEVFFRYEKRPIKRKPNVGIVARKHPLKGFKDFVFAMQSLDKDLYANVIVISHDDLSSFDLNGMILIKPKSDHEMVLALNNIDIFVSTSWQEGFGLPPLEAMACGCAVIVSCSGGVNEYAVDNENCLMYQPKNVKQLTECLNKLLIDSNLIVRLSLEGAKTSEDFSWHKSALQLVSILNFE